MSHEKSISNEALIRQLKWRYATKKFDPSKRISERDWLTLEEALVLTPSSFGLQPWKFFLVETPDIKEKLVAASWGQTQPRDASHMLVLAIRDKMDADYVVQYVRRTAEVRGVPPESLEKFKQVMLNFIARPGFDVNVWAKDQTYIALGNFMTCAAVMGIDTCPMEGIDIAKYDAILGLTKLGYTTSVACAAGYRSPECKYASVPKVRFKHEDMIGRI